jgi:hypothetical protein
LCHDVLTIGVIITSHIDGNPVAVLWENTAGVEFDIPVMACDDKGVGSDEIAVAEDIRR